MSRKEKTEARGKNRAKRLAVELAPGVRSRLEAYLQECNEDPGRVSPPVACTDVINRAIDRFLQANPEPAP